MYKNAKLNVSCLSVCMCIVYMRITMYCMYVCVCMLMLHTQACKLVVYDAVMVNMGPMHA